MIEQIGQFGWALGALGSLVLGWVGWSLRKFFVPRTALDAIRSEISGEIAESSARLQEQIKTHDGRLVDLERQLGVLPTREDLRGVQAKVEEVHSQGVQRGTQLAELVGTVKQIETLVRLLTQSHIREPNDG